MKKLLTAVMVLVVPILISHSGWALSVDDTQGATGAYYGGTYTGPSGPDSTYAYDINPNDSSAYQWSVTGLTAKKIAGGYIQVTLTGPYFGNSYAKQATVGAPGDLYISSGGWQTSSGSAVDHWASDTFNPATEGWNLVVPLGTLTTSDNVIFKATSNMHNLVDGYTETSDQGFFHSFRADQAWRGGYGATDLGTVYSILNTDTNPYTTPGGLILPADSLTFIFPDQGLNADALGYHFTPGCGNDVVEGGGTPVPEPESLLLLGLALAGLGVYRWKAARVSI